MTLTDLQRATVRAIVSLFETGTPMGKYHQVTVAKGDSGGLSYGLHQATRASGNLGLLITAYCEAPGMYADELRPYLTRLLDADPSLDNDEHLKSLLRIAGVDDPVMIRTQDAFFRRVFFEPSLVMCQRRGLSEPLSVCVVYDSRIHGGFEIVEARLKAKGIPAAPEGKPHNPLAVDPAERNWVFAYLDEREAWLRTHTKPILRKTTYRASALRSLASTTGGWSLALPIVMRGATLGADTFSYLLMGDTVRDEPVLHASADTTRLLRLRTPPMSGDDVTEVQRALTIIAPEIKLDGVYGRFTDAGVRLYQSQHGLRPDGIVGPATRVVMGL